MLQIVGKDYIPARLIIDSAGNSGNTYGLITGRASRGTAAAPTASQSGDVLMRYAGNGYGNTSFSILGTARMDMVAAENFTDTNKGTKIVFGATPTGSNTVTSNVVVITSNSVIFGSNTIVDITNNRLQVSNTGATGNTAFATTYVTYTPYYNAGSTPNGRPGDKQGMIFFDLNNLLGNGIRMYFCNKDYDGVSKIWYTQLGAQAAWS